MTRLVLVGGGHAHLMVLEHLARRRRGGLAVTLVTPSPWQCYSGMLPGWIAGRYAWDACRIDLRPLAAAAGVALVIDAVVAMDADRRTLGLAAGRTLDYDILSLDIGSETNSGALAALGDRLLPVKPLEAFQAAWSKGVPRARSAGAAYGLVIVGGGAAGVELALAIRSVLADAVITLVTGGSGLIDGHGEGVRRRVARALDRARIVVRSGRASGSPLGVVLGSGEILPAETVIAATGARAAPWLARSGLTLCGDGFVAVDPCHRSLSHPDVLAAGDVSSRGDVAIPRSGVHAVRVGPSLARNLVALSRGGPLQPYRPASTSLYLLVSGRRSAIASWGGWSAEGAWVWHWKDWIDRRFVERLARRPADRPAT